MYTPVGIELPEYCEWVRGTAYPKVSSGKPHGRLQIALGVIVYSWGHERGHVASEVDMNVRVAADDVRRYLPDIEFTSYVTLQNAADEGPEIQSVPPDLVIEIVSPTQKRGYLDEKVRAFLVAGTAVVLVVEPDNQSIVVHRSGGKSTLRRGDRFLDPRFPGLTIDLAALFDSVSRLR